MGELKAMTKLIGRTLLICLEKRDQCELCGKPAELRPYGPNGERVCFECAMADEEAAKRQFQKVLDRSENIVVIKGTLESDPSPR